MKEHVERNCKVVLTRLSIFQSKGFKPFRIDEFVTV